MAFIKEPKGIDFLIKSDPLTDEDRKAISAFIKKDKAKKPSAPLAKKNKTSKPKQKKALA